MKNVVSKLIIATSLLASIAANADCSTIRNLDSVAGRYLTYLTSDLTSAQETEMRSEIYRLTMALNFSGRGAPRSSMLSQDVEVGAFAIQCVSDRVAALCQESGTCTGNVRTSSAADLEIDPELYDPEAVYELIVDPVTIRVLDRSQAFMEMAIGRLAQAQESSNSGERIRNLVITDSAVAVGFILVSRRWVARKMPMQGRLSRMFVVRGIMRSIVRRPGVWAVSTAIGTGALSAYEEFMSQAEYESVRREITTYFQDRSTLMAPGYHRPQLAPGQELP